MCLNLEMQMENMVFFFAELAMVHYSMVKYCPSMLAASAVYAARCTLNKSPLWNETLKCHTGFSEQELLYVFIFFSFLLLLFSWFTELNLYVNRECTKMLVNFHSLSEVCFY